MWVRVFGQYSITEFQRFRQRQGQVGIEDQAFKHPAPGQIPPERSDPPRPAGKNQWIRFPFLPGIGSGELRNGAPAAVPAPFGRGGDVVFVIAVGGGGIACETAEFFLGELSHPRLDEVGSGEGENRPPGTGQLRVYPEPSPRTGEGFHQRIDHRLVGAVIRPPPVIVADPCLGSGRGQNLVIDPIAGLGGENAQPGRRFAPAGDFERPGDSQRLHHERFFTRAIGAMASRFHLREPDHHLVDPGNRSGEVCSDREWKRLQGETGTGRCRRAAQGAG